MQEKDQNENSKVTTQVVNNALSTDDKLLVTKYVIDEKDFQLCEETQDLFLEQQLNKFLDNDLPELLGNLTDIQDIEEESTSTKNISEEVLYLYNLVDDYEINLNEDDILNFLQIENRWPFKYFVDAENPRPNRPDIYGYECPVQAIVHGGNVTFTDFYDREGRFIYDEFKKFYDLGFSFMLSNVLDLTPELRGLRDKMRNYTGTRPTGNFYITNGESKNPRYTQSWKPHSHPYSAAVKIIYGTTKWIIGDQPKKDFSKGDTIFIPNETTHAVVECPGKRLSLTINLI